MLLAISHEVKSQRPENMPENVPVSSIGQDNITVALLFIVCAHGKLFSPANVST